MDRENSNSTFHLLVLIRPGDSLRIVLSSFSRLQRYTFAFCLNIFMLLHEINESGRLEVTLSDTEKAALIGAH